MAKKVKKAPYDPNRVAAVLDQAVDNPGYNLQHELSFLFSEMETLKESLERTVPIAEAAEAERLAAEATGGKEEPDSPAPDPPDPGKTTQQAEED